MSRHGDIVAPARKRPITLDDLSDESLARIRDKPTRRAAALWVAGEINRRGDITRKDWKILYVRFAKGFFQLNDDMRANPKMHKVAERVNVQTYNNGDGRARIYHWILNSLYFNNDGIKNTLKKLETLTTNDGGKIYPPSHIPENLSGITSNPSPIHANVYELLGLHQPMIKVYRRVVVDQREAKVNQRVVMTGNKHWDVWDASTTNNDFTASLHQSAATTALTSDSSSVTAAPKPTSSSEDEGKAIVVDMNDLDAAANLRHKFDNPSYTPNPNDSFFDTEYTWDQLADFALNDGHALASFILAWNGDPRDYSYEHIYDDIDLLQKDQAIFAQAYRDIDAGIEPKDTIIPQASQTASKTASFCKASSPESSNRIEKRPLSDPSIPPAKRILVQGNPADKATALGLPVQHDAERADTGQIVMTVEKHDAVRNARDQLEEFSRHCTNLATRTREASNLRVRATGLRNRAADLQFQGAKLLSQGQALFSEGAQLACEASELEVLASLGEPELASQLSEVFTAQKAVTLGLMQSIEDMVDDGVV